MDPITIDDLDPLVAFHGHMCPGLAVGVRIARIGLREVGRPPQQPVSVVAETAMCSVDAVQFLTGCTLGNGDLVFRDHGKNAFTFVRRSDGRAVRVMARPDALPPDPQHARLRRLVDEGVATDAERARFSELHLARAEMIFAMAEENLFSIEVEDHPPILVRPRPAPRRGGLTGPLPQAPSFQSAAQASSPSSRRRPSPRRIVDVPMGGRSRT